MRNAKQQFNEDKYDDSVSELDFATSKRTQFFAKKIGQGKKVLEVTSGNTLTLKYYSDQNEIYLIDLSRPVLDKAKPYIKKGYIVDLDEEDLPFRDEFFDAVVAGEIIEHLMFPQHLVDEIHRVLKKDGVFVGSTPNAFVWRRRLETLVGYQYESPIDHDHIRFFNRTYLKKLLSQFDNIHILSATRIPFFSSLLSGKFMWYCEKKGEEK